MSGSTSSVTVPNLSYASSSQGVSPAPLPLQPPLDPTLTSQRSSLQHRVRAPLLDATTPPPRQTLLEGFRSAQTREIGLDRFVDAYRLRKCAEAWCPQAGVHRRLQPRWTRSEARMKLVDDLAGRPVDELIAEIEGGNPRRYDRSVLTDVAARHFMAALHVDVDAWRAGLKQSARWEPVHTVLSRVATLGATLATSNASGALPHDAVGKAAGKAIKTAGHQLPVLVLNPNISGRARMWTNTVQARKLKGGEAVVADNVRSQTPDMGVIADRMAQRRQALDRANHRLDQALNDDGDADGSAAAQAIAAWHRLYAAAQDDYKARIALNRTQAYGKAWGAGINAIASAGTVATLAVPSVGQVVGPVMQGASALLQWPAGYVDHIVDHEYRMRANVKYGDFLTDAGRRVPPPELRPTPEHIDVQALRKAFLLDAQQQVRDIREVYELELSKLTKKAVVADERRAKSKRAEQDGDGQEMRALAYLKQQAEWFESFDPALWAKIDPRSSIGRCIDDERELARLHRKARPQRLGERESQIMQRYAQSMLLGLSSGVTQFVGDALMVDDAYLHLDNHGHAHLDSHVQDAVIGVGAVGGTTFTAATSEVRMNKQDNKKLLAERVPPQKSRRAARIEEDAERWKVDIAHRGEVDLRHSIAYDRLYHSWGQRQWRTAKTFGKAVVGAGKSMHDMRRSMQERDVSRSSMHRTLSLLTGGAPRSGPKASLSAMRQELRAREAPRGTVVGPIEVQDETLTRVSLTPTTTSDGSWQDFGDMGAGVGEGFRPPLARTAAPQDVEQEAPAPAAYSLSTDLSDGLLASIIDSDW